MNTTEYSDEQRASNRRTVIGVGVTLTGLLVGAALFGDFGPVGLLVQGLISGAFVASMWWLFAAAKAKPLEDPGPQGRRAAMMGAVFGFWGSD